MKLFAKTLLGTALLAAVGTASAADVTIYGRIDTGLLFNHNAGDAKTPGNSLTMASGSNTASRWGLKGSEQLTDTTKVIYQMENRFTSDTGAFKSFTSGKSGRMFGGQMFLGIVNQTLGEVSLGRMAGTSSGSGAYDLQYYMDAFGGGTVGTGNSPVKAARYDNMITWRTPMMAGLQGTFQYSMQNDGYDEGVDENTSDVNRYYSAALRFNRGPLNLVAIYEGITWGHEAQIESGASTSKKAVTLGGSYRFQPVTLYLQAQYYNGVNTLDGFSAKKSGNSPAGSIEGCGVYAGTQFWLSGLSSWQSMVYWKDYELHRGSSSYDGTSIGVATKFIYRPSKTVDMYVGGGFSQWNRLDDKNKKLTDKNVNFFTGVTKYF